jgi:hypothetical protein
MASQSGWLLQWIEDTDIKITAVIALVLALFATTAVAKDGDRAIQRSAAAVGDHQQMTTSVDQPAPRFEMSTSVAQDITISQTKIVVTD